MGRGNCNITRWQVICASVCGNIFARFQTDSNSGILTSGGCNLFALVPKFFIVHIPLLRSQVQLLFQFTHLKSLDHFVVTFNFFRDFLGEAVVQILQREVHLLI